MVLLGWGEIVRRATLDHAVANKHFGMADGSARSPLLATWFTSQGKLEKTGRELAVSVQELAQDLHDWPTGHMVVRHRETDDLVGKLRHFEGRQLSLAQREARIALRKPLRAMTDAEARMARGVVLMLSDPDLSSWFLKIWEPDGDAPIAIEGFINAQLNRGSGEIPLNAIRLRMSPPRGSTTRPSIILTQAEVAEIQAIKQLRFKRYGNAATDTVMELPPGVRARSATPRIMGAILDLMSEERYTLEQLREAQVLDIGSWKIELV